MVNICNEMYFCVYMCVTTVDAVPIQLAEQPTNGITYFRAISSITSLPDDLKIYVPLFCNVLTQWVKHYTHTINSGY